MYNQNNVQVEQIDLEQLPPIQNLSNSVSLVETYIKGHNWQDSFNCITELRKMNKYHSEHIADIIARFSPAILDILNTGKTLLVKNIFRLIKQLFDAGQQINVQKVVQAFLPVLIKKASTDIGYMRNSAQKVLTSFSCNCGYEVSFIIASGYCSDKNPAVAELSVTLLAALIHKVGPRIIQLAQNTLTSLMECLSCLIKGKRQNLTNSALDICVFLCGSIGSQNFLKLMQFCLKYQEVQTMGTSMQCHRLDKQKPIRLKQAIKSRKTEAFNAQFFDGYKLNNNFIPFQKQTNFTLNSNQSKYNQEYR